MSFILLGKIGFIQAQNSSLNYFADSPDSIIFYSDSLESVATYSFINDYSDNKISSIRRYLDNNQWVNDIRIEYYLDNKLPELKFEPILGGSSGNSNGYDYTYESSIGDSISITYSWDAIEEVWINTSKTRHYFSETGIDTLAITHIWDSDLESWELNNSMKQEFIENSEDSVFMTMIAPNNEDTLFDYLYVYKYDTENRVQVRSQSSHGSVDIDSMVYKNGLLVFEYKGDEEKYDYLYEHRYDENNRKKSTFFWDKQSGQVEWEFDGAINFYYPQDSTSIRDEIIFDKISLYPSPSSNYITLSGYKGIVRISNMTGQIVDKVFIDHNGILDINHLHNGMYLLILKNGITKKILKK